MKYIKVLAVLFLLLGTSLVFASTDDQYAITDVEVEDVSAFDLPIYVERGETIKVEVFLEGLVDNDTDTDFVVDNVRVEAELGGYDRDTVRETTDSFIIEEGVTYPAKKLELELPDDLESGVDYQLRIRVFDRDNEVEWTDDPAHNPIILRVEEKEHLISIEDVSFDPNLNQVRAGDRLYANVRVKNFGSTEEEDVRVIMEIPTLSLSTSSFINELNTEEQCTDEYDDECDESQTEQVSLLIPETAFGSHEVVIRVEYDNGDEVLEQTFTLDLGAAPQGEGEEERETVIDITPEQQSIAQGEGVAYKIVITNLASESMTYTVSAQDLETWATFDIQPSIVTVAPDSSEEVFIFVTANEDASAGTKFFTATIKTDTTEEEVTLEAKVVEKEDKGIAFGDIRTGLEIGFIILLIILVILGIVLAIRRGGRREEFEEPAEKGKSYY